MVTSDNPKVRKGMDLIDSMEVEELDALVDYIRQVFKSKRQQDRNRAFATLKVGDRVRYHNCRPLYLNGMTGTILEKRESRFRVQLDRPTGKFRTGIVISSPSSLEKIEG